MSASGPLAIWMNDLRVGTWAQPRTGAPTFHYDPAWIASDAARVLSLSRPFIPGNTPHRGAVVSNFFENLLPDSAAIRRRLQARFATGSTEAFDPLTAIGRDCVGAVQLLPDDEKPTGFDEVKGTPLDESGVEQTINAAVSGARLLGQIDDADFRLSLAGAQEKTAVPFHRNRWFRPSGATPTTHIFKLPLGLVGNLQADLQDSVENAWLCSRLVAAFGLETPPSEIAQFGARKVLVVERFDRAKQSDWIARLPQEDFCQAIGLPRPSNTNRTAARAAATVCACSIPALAPPPTNAPSSRPRSCSGSSPRPTATRRTSLSSTSAAAPTASPLFTRCFPRGPSSARAATHSLGQKRPSPWPSGPPTPLWKLKDIRPRHWSAVAQQAGLGDADALIHEILTLVPSALSTVGNLLPKTFPTHVSEKISSGIAQQAKVLAAG